jgi:hypothetical protein
VSKPLSAHLYLADGILIVRIGEYQKEMADGFARLKRDNEGDRLEAIRKRIFDDVQKQRAKNEKGLSITTRLKQAVETMTRQVSILLLGQSLLLTICCCSPQHSVDVKTS